MEGGAGEGLKCHIMVEELVSAEMETQHMKHLFRVLKLIGDLVGAIANVARLIDVLSRTGWV